jgi:hypothetical protein
MKNRAQVGRVGLVGLAAVFVLVGAGQARSSNEAGGHLFASVTRAGRVSLSDDAGRRVTRTPAGSYVIAVRDRSKGQNFHLVGPSSTPSKRTGIRFVGTVRWALTLTAGTYRYYSDREPMRVLSFRVDG